MRFEKTFRMHFVWLLPAIAGLGSLLFYQANALPSPDGWRTLVASERRGELRDLTLAPNGDIIAVGFVSSSRGMPDGWIARYSPDGSEVWSRTLGSPVREELNAVVVGADNSIVVTGAQFVTPTQSQTTAAVLDGSGQVLWYSHLKDTKPIYGSDVALIEGASDRAEVLVLSETMRAVDDVSYQARAARLTHEDGSVIWDARLSASAFAQTGHVLADRPALTAPPGKASISHIGESSIKIHQIQGTASRCFEISAQDGSPLHLSTNQACTSAAEAASYIGGTTALDVSGDVMLIKIGRDGAVVWERKISTQHEDGLNAVVQLADGTVIGVGYVINDPSDNGSRDGLVVKFDPAGKLLSYTPVGSDLRDELTAAVVLPDNSLIVGGYRGNSTHGEWSPWLERLTP